MPRSGIAIAIDDNWRKRVRAAMADRGWRQADLAREVGCRPSVISEILGGRVSQSPYVSDIHERLGWEPPLPPVLSADAAELLYIWDHLDEVDRARFLERGRTILEERARKRR